VSITDGGSANLEGCGADAVKWARAFNRAAVDLGYQEMDEGWLIGWFANAIMQSHDVLSGNRLPVLLDGSSFFVA
jgi:hypothetical protein